MVFLAIVSLLISSLSLRVLAQGDQTPIVYDAIHNATVIYGTWATGAMNVVTGPGFANPANETFSYPLTTGMSYSFTPDGYYEIARYRFNANGSQPSCITGVLNWVHGTYELMPNGSIVCTPFGDGFQQIQDPCAAQSNFIQGYNDTELYQSWRIFQDPVQGYKLHLFQFDNSPLPPQFQVSTQPEMLPTTLLRNVTPAGFTSQNGFVNTGDKSVVKSTSAAGSQRLGNVIGASTIVTAAIGAGVLVLLAL